MNIRALTLIRYYNTLLLSLYLCVNVMNISLLRYKLKRML